MRPSHESHRSEAAPCDRLAANTPAEQENMAQEGQPPDGAPRMHVREEDAMQIDGVEGEAPASFAAVSESRKRKADDAPLDSGAIKFRRIESKEVALKRQLETREAITKAIVAGDIDELEKLIGPDSEMLEMKHPLSKATPLHEAVWADNLECVKLLLEWGAHVNCIWTKQAVIEGRECLEYYAQFKILSGNEECSFFCDEKYSPLIDAVGRDDLALVELLFKHGAECSKQPINFDDLLYVAIRSDNANLVKILLAKNPNPLSMRDEGCSALVDALCRGNLEITRLIIEAVAPERRSDFMAQSLCEYRCTVEELKLLCEYGLDLNWIGKTFEDSGETQTLLECLLIQPNVECVDYMLEQGCSIDLSEVSRYSPALSSVFSLDLMKRLLQRVNDPQLREKFINALLFKMVTGNSAADDTRETVQYLIERGASPFFKWPDSDYLFHEAAGLDRPDVVLAFIEKYPAYNFSFIGTEGKTPIGLSASRYSSKVLNLLLMHVESSKAQEIFLEELGHACKEFNLIAIRNIEPLMFDPQLATNLIASTFSNALKANNLKFIEAVADNFDLHRIDELMERSLRAGVERYHVSAAMQFCVSLRALKINMRRHNWPVLFSAQNQPDHILKRIARHTEKNGDDLDQAVFDLCRSTELSLAIGSDILTLYQALHYMAPAVVSLAELPRAMQDQFACFIVHALPDMPARNAYLLDDGTTQQDLWPGNGGLLTRRIVHQLHALYLVGEQAQVKFRKSLRKALPRICSSCIAPGTGLLRVDKLEKKLQEFGLFRQNALRVIDVLKLAYAALATRDNTVHQSSNLQDANWRLQQQFASQLTEEFTASLAAVLDPENEQGEVSLAASRAQAEFSVALRSLNEPDYMRAQGRETIDNAFSALVGGTFPALLWWQMDQVCQAFDLRLPGEEAWESRRFKPFLAFQARLEKDKNVHDPLSFL